MPVRTTKNISITMPVVMAKEATRLAKRERRTVSELFREALRHYQASRRTERIHDDEWVARIFQEARENPMTPAQIEAEDEVLGEYGARQARKFNVKEEDVVRIIHESRARRKTS